MNLIEQLETEEIKRLNKTIPDFSPGDTVIVNVKVVEGDRSRVQAYEGVVIANAIAVSTRLLQCGKYLAAKV